MQNPLRKILTAFSANKTTEELVKGAADVTEEAIKTNRKKFGIKNIGKVSGATVMLGAGSTAFYKGMEDIYTDYKVGITLILIGGLFITLGTIAGYYSVKAIVEVGKGD